MAKNTHLKKVNHCTVTDNDHGTLISFGTAVMPLIRVFQ
jgi:hypothetical protein